MQGVEPRLLLAELDVSVRLISVNRNERKAVLDLAGKRVTVRVGEDVTIHATGRFESKQL